MTLSPGTRFGAYEIVGPVGAGGMGEVYRARDHKLGRDVAIKILPAAFATDADRLMRFEREARTLASLNHPNIAQIYGHEQFGDLSALVLEFIDGPTLADRIRQQPIDGGEAVAIAKQLCAALAAAHDHGVVHRDLKPANIKVRPDGTVKVLDFGLAKLAGSTSDESSHGATITSPATMRGEILGTAAYMSPEQARGLAVDRRTDIWAFGCVLYEMLTGKRAFDGSSVTDVLAAVIKEEPDWQSLPADVPAGVGRVLTGCLRKDPTKRLRDAAHIAIDLEDADSAHLDRRSRPSPSWRGAAVAVVTAAIGFALGLAFGVGRNAAPPSRPVGHFTFRIPDVNRVGDSRIAISPDGTRVAYTAVGRTNRSLYIHDLDAESPRVVPAVSDPNEPFFSPDGEWVGVHASGRLLRVNVSTLAADEIARVEGAFFGGAWTSDGAAIVFSQRGRIRRVAVTGGAITDLIHGEGATLRFPFMLPGDGKILYSSVVGPAPPEIIAHNLHTGERRVIVRGDDARYLPTGHLVVIRNGTLFVAPFDASRLQLTGPESQALDGVQQTTSTEGGIFAVSQAAQLVYARSLEGGHRRLVIVDRNGIAAPIDMPLRNLQTPRLSPQGTKIVFEDLELPHSIWIHDLTSGALNKLPPPDGRHNPIWSSDGARVVFQAFRDGNAGSVHWMPADGSGPEEMLVTARQWNLNPVSWSPGGEALAVVEVTNGDRNILVHSMRSGGALQTVVDTPASESMAQFSPNGRWLAYVSNASKRDEVYVRSFPNPDGLWQVSSGGGSQPLWSRDGRELFYRRGNAVVAVAVNSDGVFTPGRPRELFSNGSLMHRTYFVDYDVFPDGQRFVMVEELNPSGSQQLHVVTEWFDELKRAREPRR